MGQDEGGRVVGQFQELGQRGDWSVRGCPSGCIHLRLGPASHRFSLVEWRLLVEMCVQATLRLEAREALALADRKH